MTLKHYKNFIACLFLAGAIALVPAATALAQLLEDPASLPIPDFTTPDSGRAVVVSVEFNTRTDVSLESVVVSRTRAKGSVADPDLIRLESLDQNGDVIGEQSSWHPLWTHDWDEAGEQETGDILTSGKGTFYLPLRGNLAGVRIIDVKLEQELLTVDVSSEVAEYCNANPASPICDDAPTTDPCQESPCQNDGVCSPDLDSYICSCAPGYTGTICEQDIDECAAQTHTCDQNATCTNSPGSFSCECNAGYQGDGFSCTLIEVDNCPSDPNKTEPGICGCGVSDVDTDSDGIADCLDNCPTVANPGQEDSNGNGIGDACDEDRLDSDNDGVLNDFDQCPNTSDGSIVDASGCAIADYCPCDGSFKNRGRYVSCVSKKSSIFLDAKLITEAEHSEIVSKATKSHCLFAS